ncbi:MSHA biogenesis protein MshD [Vibrio sp. TBV020]|uniref:MSHA biogenesis protein MshD n=1 Tax=Vibrio sp. TBV020 TaxID=3137398 RepID=UPI0038CDC8DE
MRKNVGGFTLFEAVIVTIILGLAVVTFSSFLAPQLSQSGEYHYFSRSAALGQSVMTEMLSIDTNVTSLASAADDIVANLGPDYANFELEIDINPASGAANLQQITLNITASSQSPVTFTGFRGEY